MAGLAALNAADAAWLRDEFLKCCHATRWANQLAARRPFAAEADLFAAAEEIWWQMSTPDILEAFAGHPRIGDLASLRARYANTAGWAAGEQAGAAAASEEMLEALAAGNRAYEARFGHIFIVCATGKTAAEMLATLQARLPNGPDDELRVAAGEQAKITRIRLEKLLTS
ncbi:MAG: 2-oxo-4-hydroxy-4-carboxy-5-ureidoimidazoline decarboxylase [Candidatus Sericytochromatia bacterium]|nr:2-oxo-4-hydroxy-4-carboxy-5-ureidoimidazoline decarboxylase [Candidatus Tanganyikabacteria bacterium]